MWLVVKKESFGATQIFRRNVGKIFRLSYPGHRLSDIAINCTGKPYCEAKMSSDEDDMQMGMDEDDEEMGDGGFDLGR